MHSEATTFRFFSSNNLKYQNGQYSCLKQRKFVNELVRAKKGSSKLHNLAHYPISFVKIFKANFLDSYGIFDLHTCAKYKQSCTLSINNLFLVENDFYHTYQIMNIETKGIG